MFKILAFVSVFVMLASCKNRTSQVNALDSKANTCVAIRGNGHYIITHFGALARIVEDYGAVDGLAGGSSGSISTFLYESMVLNPSIKNCEGCSEINRRARLSLLLKSTRGLIDAAQQSPEAVAVRGIFAELELLKQQITNITAVNPRKIAKNILAIINSSSLKELINWELFGMLVTASGQTAQDLTVNEIREILTNAQFAEVRIQNNPHLKFAIAQIRSAFETFGAFKADSQEIFFRPGVVNFYAFTEVVGRVGDFYAGRGPYDQNQMEMFLEKCARDSFGLPWSEFIKAGRKGEECAQIFANMSQGYFKAHSTERIPNSRLNDIIGAGIPAVVTTGIIDGKADVEQLNQSQLRFWNEDPPNFSINFERIFAGYWAPSKLSEDICSTVKLSNDEKGTRCLALGEATWANILPYSPAEPGLSRALTFPDANRASLGGWVDLAPVDALKAAGCENVIYLTRRQDESPFVAGVARQLNMDLGNPARPMEKALFDLNNDKSSISGSLQRADLTWCTDWNTFSDLEVDNMMDESYCAEVILNNPDFQIGPYSTRMLAKDSIRGCTYKAPEGKPRSNPKICKKLRSSSN